MHRVTRMYDYVAGMSKCPTDPTTTSTVTTAEIEKSPDAEKEITKETESDTENNNKVNPIDYMQMNGSGTDTIDGVSIPNKLRSGASAENLSEELGGVLTNELKITELDYFDSNENNANKMSSDEFSQNCMNVLESVHSDYIFQPSNIPVASRGFEDYLVQPSNIPITVTNPPPTPTSQSECGDYLVQPSNRKVEQNYENEPTHMYLSFKKSQDQLSQMSASTNKLKTNSLRRQGSDISKASVDDELAEIINDFKNNVFTIQEVEQLVASWKNRNDVQQSFKDKQDQLQKMREEYDRIQSQMKEKLKRPTPFERMKKLFSRSKSANASDCKEGARADIGDASGLLKSPKSSHRPRSSLSLQSISSSSSSGRMSTGSACSGTSLGDSGTHSDHEERRHAFSTTCQIGHPGSLMDNYMIPPAPRPVHQINTPASTPTPNEEKINPFFGAAPMVTQTSTASYSEHYVLFPSNTPIYQTPPNHGHHDYLNFPAGLNTIVETPNENCVSIQPIKIQTPSQPLYSQTTKGNPMSSCSSFKASSPSANNFNDLVKYDGKYGTNNFNIVSKDGDKKSGGSKLDRQILNINNCDYENLNGSDCLEIDKSDC